MSELMTLLGRVAREAINQGVIVNAWHESTQEISETLLPLKALVQGIPSEKLGNSPTPDCRVVNCEVFRNPLPPVDLKREFDVCFI